MKLVCLILWSQATPGTTIVCRIILPPGKLDPASTRILAQAIRSLPRFLQLLLLLLCYDELPAEAAAELLALSPASVETGLAHALDCLHRKTARKVGCDDVQSALAYAIEHESFPEEQIRRVRASLERSFFDSPCTDEEEKI